MRRRLWLLLTVVLIGVGFEARAASPATDDGSEPRDAFGLVGPFIFSKPLVLVTYVKSRTADPIRAATVVSVTNQTKTTCAVSVAWFQGLGAAPVCATALRVSARAQTDFCSRAIPDALTTCNATCAPELTFHEGTAVVSIDVWNPFGIADVCDSLAVSARIYYTTGATDDALTAMSDSKIVRVDEGNRGD